MTTPVGESALILPVRLPAPLEEIRRRGVAEARLGLPAHATLLFPFAQADLLDDELRARVVGAIGRHPAFRFRLTERREWPGAVYAAVEPEVPFRSLFGALAAAFPEYPLFGGAFPFVPHVTIVEPRPGPGHEVFDDAAWDSLPIELLADAIELIVREPGGWTVRSRFALTETP